MMVSAEYAKVKKDRDYAFFWLTRRGLDWLGEKLGIYIHDKED